MWIKCLESDALPLHNSAPTLSDKKNMPRMYMANSLKSHWSLIKMDTEMFWYVTSLSTISLELHYIYVNVQSVALNSSG